jgi:Holliday junction resolvase RusA-like endonuclease
VRRLTLTLDGEQPQSANKVYAGKGGYHARAREATRVHQLVYREAFNQWRDASPLTPPVRVTMTVYLPDGRRCDLDNKMPPKMYLDGLVATGIIPDDDTKTVREITLRAERDPARPRVELAVEEIEA